MESEIFNLERRNAKPQNLKGKAKKEVKKGRCSGFYCTPLGGVATFIVNGKYQQSMAEATNQANHKNQRIDF